MKILKKRLAIWVDYMIKKIILQYTVGLPILIIGSVYILLHFGIEVEFKLFLLKHLWSPAT